MPSHSAANSEIKQLYINGHFCYAYKFGIVTNGLGIIRHLAFYDKDFFASHPEIKIEKKSDSPDEDKSVHDARLLIPTLTDFFHNILVSTQKRFSVMPHLTVLPFIRNFLPVIPLEQTATFQKPIFHSIQDPDLKIPIIL